MSTTSGASASGSTALSRAALWHQSGSAHSYESEPSQNVVMATRRGWPEAAGCALQAASWRVASMWLLRRGLWFHGCRTRQQSRPELLPRCRAAFAVTARRTQNFS
eukprot:scaffold39050_cov61-Phaeocystis_antarctica.AAC.2